MNLLTIKEINHSAEDIKAFDMDKDSTIRVTVEPFKLVVNYNKEDGAGVAEEVKRGLKAYCAELLSQVHEL